MSFGSGLSRKRVITCCNDPLCRKAAAAKGKRLGIGLSVFIEGAGSRPTEGTRLRLEPDGRATIDLWCNSVEGKIVVVDSSVTVTTGRQTDRQCDPARMRGDDELLAVLSQVVSWTRERDLLTLHGPKNLRFRQPSN